VPLLSVSLYVCVYKYRKKKRILFTKENSNEKWAGFVVGHQRHKQHIFSIKIFKKKISVNFLLFKKKKKKNLLSSLFRGVKTAPNPTTAAQV
jgi:hypothetical protein